MSSHLVLDELAERKRLIDSAIEETVAGYPCEVPVIREAMAYALEGGKRLRGAILLSTFESLGGTGNAMPFAVGLEMIQAYSLVHDDLPCMDDDDMRRGKPTCHKKFGEAIGVLTGDALLTLAFEVAASSELEPSLVVRGIRALAYGAGAAGMVGGQVLDLQLEGAAQRPEKSRVHSSDDVREMYRLKTGRLFEASAKIGAILAGVPEDTVNRATQAGLLFGYSYQILDDIDDLSQGGKEEDKDTLVKRTSLELARQEAADNLRKCIETAEPGWLLSKLSTYFLQTRLRDS